MHARIHIVLGLSAMLALLVACDKEQAAPKLKGDETVLAHVNGTSITQYDLDRTIRDLLGEKQGAQLDAEGRKQMLESLVQSRAIAQAQEKKLSAEQRLELDRKAAAYREELLVKEYLSKHTRPRAVSAELVRKYYETHRERFGAGKVRAYELLTTVGSLPPSESAKAMVTLGTAAAQTDWSAWIDTRKRAGGRFALRSGQDDDVQLHPTLRTLITQLAVGETSRVTLIDGAPYAVRVTAERDLPGKQLAEVSEEIRKTLAPTQIADAVKQASAQVLKSSEVAYR